MWAWAAGVGAVVSGREVGPEAGADVATAGLDWALTVAGKRATQAKRTKDRGRIGSPPARAGDFGGLRAMNDRRLMEKQLDRQMGK